MQAISWGLQWRCKYTDKNTRETSSYATERNFFRANTNLMSGPSSGSFGLRGGTGTATGTAGRATHTAVWRVETEERGGGTVAIDT